VTFELKIYRDNAVVQTGEDVADALSEVATRVRGHYGAEEIGPGSNFRGGTFRNPNGITTGSWRMIWQNLRSV